MKVYLWGTVIMLFLSACSQDSIFQGISQDSSRDAKIEQAKIDLDNSNYDQVISDLSSVYTTNAVDPTVGQLMASAYMGKAGIDLTLFIATSSSSGFISISTSTGLNPIDVMSSMISLSNVKITDNEKYITSTLMPNILSYLTSAKRPLQIMTEQGTATSDDIIQLGFASAADFIMFMGNATKLESMPINKAAYKATALAGVGANNFAVTATTSGIPSYQEDLINIYNAVQAFKTAFPKPKETNQMKDSLNDFLEDVLSAALGTTSGVKPTKDLITQCTSAGLYNYAQSLAK
jgi:hypothetical protein